MDCGCLPHGWQDMGLSKIVQLFASSHLRGLPFRPADLLQLDYDQSSVHVYNSC